MAYNFITDRYLYSLRRPIVNFENLNILIVDDISTVQKVMNKTLKEVGVKSTICTDNNLDAWNIINERIGTPDKIDVVFCDWNMPKGDGIYLLKKIRASENENIKWIKFIMVTGSNEKVLEAMDEGANNVIHKPFNKEVILSKFNIIFR